MFITEVKPVVVAVRVALSGVGPSASLARLVGVRVLFPDIGVPSVQELGFLRYPGERSIVVPEATDEELQLPGGLTNQL